MHDACAAMQAASYRCKLMLVGPGAVGKTTLAMRLMHGEWHDVDFTDGLGVHDWSTPLPEGVGQPGEQLTFSLWDFGGQVCQCTCGSAVGNSDGLPSQAIPSIAWDLIAVLSIPIMQDPAAHAPCICAMHALEPVCLPQAAATWQNLPLLGQAGLACQAARAHRTAACVLHVLCCRMCTSPRTRSSWPHARSTCACSTAARTWAT